MSYCAQVDDNNIVLNVILLDDFPEQQMKEYIKDVLGLDGKWVKASDDGEFRYNYPSPGYYWDETALPDGAFIPPKVDDSMVLNTKTYRWEFPN